jgi:hypothetical protein
VTERWQRQRESNTGLPFLGLGGTHPKLTTRGRGSQTVNWFPRKKCD